jgi:hypothetical protein
MTIGLPHITRDEALRLLRRGLVTPQEVATMAGKTRQAGRLWALEFPGARAEYLRLLHCRTLAARSRIRSPERSKKPILENAPGADPKSSVLAREPSKKAPSRKLVEEV